MAQVTRELPVTGWDGAPVRCKRQRICNKSAARAANSWRWLHSRRNCQFVARSRLGATPSHLCQPQQLPHPANARAPAGMRSHWRTATLKSGGARSLHAKNGECTCKNERSCDICLVIQSNPTQQLYMRRLRKTRNSSGDEIANVNFLYDDIVQCTCTKNAVDSCINSATDRFLQRRFTKFSEITQCNGH